MKYIVFCIMISFMCCSSSQTFRFFPRNVPGYSQYRWEDDSTTLVLSSVFRVSLGPVELNPGKYTIQFKARGTTARSEEPLMNVFFGNTFITKASIKTIPEVYNINFEIKEKVVGPVELEFINDYSSETEDRDIYLSFPVTLSSY